MYIYIYTHDMVNMVTFTYLHINIFKLFICFDIFIYPKLAIDTYIHMYTCIHVYIYIYTQCTYKTKLSGEHGKNNNNNQTDSKNAIADTDTNSQTNANKT